MSGPLVGVAYRPELHQAILDARADVQVVEVMVDHYIHGGPTLRGYMEDIARLFPVVAHGVGLSLGSASRPDRSYLEEVQNVIDRLGAVNYSEHLAFTKGSSLDTAALLPVPRTPEVLAILLENISFVQEFIRVPFLFENITYYFGYAFPQIDEAPFIASLAALSGARILLDVENLYINSINHSFSIDTFLSGIRPNLIKALHIAGGGTASGLLIDSHDRSPRPPVMDILRKVSASADIATIILERDEALDKPFEVISDVRLVKRHIR
jgi:uncharacterized protein (UPF0276 family)